MKTLAGFAVAAASALALNMSVQAEDYTVSVDFASDDAKSFEPYFRSTGWSPGDLFLTADLTLSMDYLGAMRGGFDFVRPHYMLDLIGVEKNDDGSLTYDWTNFDIATDVTVRNGIAFDFEWMGNPGGHFNGYRTPEELKLWRGFVRDVTQHLVDRYGEEEIRTWYFESTNEPDVHPFWVHGAGEFLNYFDATRAGMRDVLPDLNLGGPGNGRFVSPILKLFLEHMSENHPHDPPAFISAHTKAAPWVQVRFEEWTVEYIKEKHPDLANVPYMNNEADPIGGWGIPYWWRTGPWHAAFFAQAIDLHNRILIDKQGVNYALFGSDHGFMGTWGQRTLFARFIPGDNSAPQKGSGDEGGWKPFDQTFENDDRPLTTQFFLVKKPALTIKTMMSFLGTTRFPVEGFPDYERKVDRYLSDNLNIGCLATQRTDAAYAIMCYNRPEVSLNTGLNAQMTASETQLEAMDAQNGSVTLQLSGVDYDTARLTEIRLDNEIGNPYDVWQNMGAPEDLSDEQYGQLVAVQEPGISRQTTIEGEGGNYSINVDLPSASVSLVLLTQDLGDRPAKISNISFVPFLGETGSEGWVIKWGEPRADALVTYELQYCPEDGSNFETITPDGHIALDFTHLPHGAGGEYRVRAISLDGKAGRWSAKFEPTKN